MSRETTHDAHLELDDGAGIIHFLLTISGTCGSESVADLDNYTPHPAERNNVVRKYVSVHTTWSMRFSMWLLCSPLRVNCGASSHCISCCYVLQTSRYNKLPGKEFLSFIRVFTSVEFDVDISAQKI